MSSFYVRRIRGLFISILLISSLFAFELSAQQAADNEAQIRPGQVLEDSGIRQRCEYMQAIRRRVNYLLRRYQELRQRTVDLIEQAPFERRTVREELQRQQRRLNGKIAFAERESRSLSERIVRRGCPLRDFDQISEEDVRQLFYAAEREGVFVDDHVLEMEDFGDYWGMLRELEDF